MEETDTRLLSPKKIQKNIYLYKTLFFARSETKFFGYAVNQLLIKSVGKLSLENTQELSKKLHVLVAEKTKAAKESAEKEKKKKDEYAEKGADDLVRGNVAREEDEGMCRITNCFKKRKS